MAYSNIDKPNQYFNGLPYTGNDTATSYNNGLDMNTNGGLVWLKSRNAVGDHGLFDSVRGVNKRIRSNTTDVEDTLASNGVTSFDSTGFSLGTVAYNDTPYTFMSWSWLAGGTASSNTDGSITSQVSANTTSGFSIVGWTGNGSASATVGHGLGEIPSMILCKERTGTDYWHVYHKNLSTNQNLFLNTTGAALNVATGTNDGGFACPQTSSSTFSFVQGLSNVDAINQSGITNIAYCFAEKKGYSKFGSFTGNGNADGTFVYTGFKPAFIITKLSSGTGSWFLHDNKRNGYNGGNNYVYPNGSDAELTTQLLDITSNGFKMRFAGGANSSGTSIYMAFAESPLVGSNLVPNNAR